MKLVQAAISKIHPSKKTFRNIE